jgi:7,8-dihydropterin-6-yl-methyl-4-(beta-D-ribofuranosyl)aminobenzene 5'-phosphate synthase
MRQNSTQITVLIENTVRLPGLKAEHGWSVYIESEHGKILFDTGQSSQMVDNASLLNIDLGSIEKVVVSHGHFDHTGGLPELLKLNPSVLVYAHPDIFKTRFYRRPGGSAREIGIAQKELDLSRFVLSREPVVLFPGCLTTGLIPIREGHITTEGNFFEDPGATRRDQIQDDQALILDGEQGLTVILGCCHVGLKATFDQVRKLTGKSSIFMVLGGMHLVDASNELLEQTIQTLNDFSVRKIGLGHCTGYQGAMDIQAAFPERCFPCNTGLQLRV